MVWGWCWEGVARMGARCGGGVVQGVGVVLGEWVHGVGAVLGGWGWDGCMVLCWCKVWGWC